MIKLEHLTKCYGDFMAVDDLSFEIEEGHVYGFLGPNGAGKSTTMNIMAGCLSATEGKISIGGYDIFEEPEVAKKLIGYLPEQPPLYMNETPLEYLQFVGEAKGIKGAELRRQIDTVIEQTGIGHVKNRLISTLSKGYKQRVGIAQALLGNPKVIILDAQKQGSDLVFSVFNTTQMPIPKEKLALIFERFYRIDPSRSTMTGGYGIGLSVAKAIVNAHNGKINADTLGESSLQITVTLPCQGA